MTSLRNVRAARWLLAASGLVACGGSTAGNQPDGGAQVDPSGAGGSGQPGAAGGGGPTGSGGLEPPESTLADHCELTPQSTDWHRSIAREMCFSTELFFTEGREENRHFEFPTFRDLGAGGGGGAGPETVESCPMASEMDWSCLSVEGTACAVPQCEAPTTPAPTDGACCYVAARVSGA